MTEKDPVLVETEVETEVEIEVETEVETEGKPFPGMTYEQLMAVI